MLDVLVTSEDGGLYILQQLLLLQLTCTTVGVAAVACIVGKSQLLLM